MSSRDLIVVLLFPLLMAVQSLAAKIGQADFPTMFMLAMRFGLVALIMVPLLPPPPKNRLWDVALLGLVQGVMMMGLFYVGVAHTTAALATVVFQLNVPFGIALSFVFFGEKVSKTMLTGMAIAMAGIAIAVFPSIDWTSTEGIPIVMLSALAMAMGNLLARSLQNVAPHTTNAWMALFAVPFALVISALFEHDQIASLSSASWTGWAALLTTSLVGGIAALGAWYHLLAKYPVSKVTPFSLLQPGIVAVGGWLILSEPITTSLLLGGMVTVLGVLLALRGQVSRSSNSAEGSIALSPDVAEAVARYVSKRRAQNKG